MEYAKHWDFKNDIQSWPLKARLINTVGNQIAFFKILQDCQKGSITQRKRIEKDFMIPLNYWKKQGLFERKFLLHLILTLLDLCTELLAYGFEVSFFKETQLFQILHCINKKTSITSRMVDSLAQGFVYFVYQNMPKLDSQ